MPNILKFPTPTVPSDGSFQQIKGEDGETYFRELPDPDEIEGFVIPTSWIELFLEAAQEQRFDTYEQREIIENAQIKMLRSALTVAAQRIEELENQCKKKSPQTPRKSSTKPVESRGLKKSR